MQSSSPGQDSNRQPPDYKSGILPRSHSKRANEISRLLDALLDGRLFDGGVEYFGDVVDESAQVHGEDLRQRERVRVHVELDAGLLHQFVPVAVAHRFVFEVHDQRQSVTESLQPILKSSVHLTRPLSAAYNSDSTEIRSPFDSNSTLLFKVLLLSALYRNFSQLTNNLFLFVLFCVL